MQKTDSEKTLRVSIRSANDILFEGDARALSSYNKSGLFDVLPMHSHFISIIMKKITVHLNGKDKQTFELDSGVMQVADNTVDVFLGFQPLDESQTASMKNKKG